MNPLHGVSGPLEHVKALWAELAKTSKKSARYKVLVHKIRTEANAYLAGVDAATNVDRRHVNRRK